MWSCCTWLSANNRSPANDALPSRPVVLLLLFFSMAVFSAPLKAAEPFEITKPNEDADWSGVAADFDGDVLVIADKPAAYVYERDGNEWLLVQKLLLPEENAARSSFGDDVSIDGDTIVVSNKYENVDGITWAGAIYVFNRSDSGEWTLSQRLTADGPREDAYFGEAVEVERDVIVTRAPRYASEGGPYTPDGIVYVFEYDKQREQWQQVAKFGKPADYSEVFAYHMAFSDGIIVVPENQEGGLIIYEREGDGWHRTYDIPLEEAGAVAVNAGVIAADGSEDIRLFERSASGNWRLVGLLDGSAVELALETEVLAVLPGYLAGRIEFYHDYFSGRPDEWDWRHAQSLVFDSGRNLGFALSEKYLLANNGSRVLVYELSEVLPEIIDTDNNDGGASDDPDDGSDDGGGSGDGNDDTGGDDGNGGDTGSDDGDDGSDSAGDTDGDDVDTGDDITDDDSDTVAGNDDSDTGDDTSGGGGGASGALLLLPLAFLGLYNLRGQTRTRPREQTPNAANWYTSSCDSIH